ncbi:thioredoxin domain-containing protein [Chondromyces crocatus]|nr:DUF255 domain-containing protein [Chondromyces crocatus]
MRWLRLPLALPFALLACVPPASRPPPTDTSATPATKHGLVPEGTPPQVDIARSRARGGEQRFTWSSWSAESLARAKREGKYILIDGAAAWCHWCHVMDETTYLDPEVGRVLQERFVTIRFDVDEHPDLAERYIDWGWPATILLTPDARELGKYRGYLPPDELREILGGIDRAAAALDAAPRAQGVAPADKPAPPEALGWIAARLGLDMNRYYDAEQGGWGRQKVPIGWNVLFELRRAAHGDDEARMRAVFTLGKHRLLIDPVWGGIYQYSVGGVWDDPHFEKLMPLQAANLEAFARAHALTKDPALLADARKLAGYLDRFLSNSEGAFLVSQDADVGSHDRQARFVDGHVYYQLGDAERRALGIPRVDDSVYGYENGLAIAALCALHEVTGDAAPLARARRAADGLLRTHVNDDGSVRRPRPDGAERKGRYLADHAGLGLGLARLAERTGEASYREAAVRIAAALDRDFTDPGSGAWMASTPDPAAVGVFARQERPISPNALAARLQAALHRLTGDEAYRERGRRALAGLATPAALAAQGRMLGELLLAMDDLELYPW